MPKRITLEEAKRISQKYKDTGIPHQDIKPPKEPDFYVKTMRKSQEIIKMLYEDSSPTRCPRCGFKFWNFWSR